MPIDTIELLKEGNLRYQDKGPVFEKLTFEKRTKLSAGQQPKAIFLSCSDSRVPLELIFNQSHGSLFVVRTAGNTFDKVALGSIEFGLMQLNIPLIVVMGHTNCGMVQTVLQEIQDSKKNSNLSKSIKYIIDIIKPAFKSLEYSQISTEVIKKAVIKNIEYTVKRLLEESLIISKLVEENKVKVVGAIYNINTGQVDFLS